MSFKFLAYGVGYGKTKASLDMALAEGCERVIVFAPSVLKSMKHWEKEGEKWGIPLPIEVNTYHKLQQYGSGKLNHKLPNGGKDVAIIIDESQKAKNSQSLQGLGAFKLVRDNPNACVYLLSGTPCPNGYVDMCNYAKMTGFVKNKTDFFARYVIQVDYRGFPEIKGYRNTNELDVWWREIADIKPPQIFTSEHDIWVDFPSVIDELTAKRERVVKINGETVLLENASKLSHFCRQACANTKIREEWLINFFESTEDNIVVFTTYKESANRVYEIAKKLKKSVYRVDGDVKELPATDDVKNSVTVVNYQSGGAGLNLQYANHAIFYSPTYSYADYIQARGRISRRGQERACNFYHLKANRSIETDIYDCLSDKKDFNIKLWDVNYKQDVIDIMML